jgi:hypothetical protein
VEAEENHSGLIWQETSADGHLDKDWHDLSRLLLRDRFHSLHPQEAVSSLYARWVRVLEVPLDCRPEAQRWSVFRLT